MPGLDFMIGGKDTCGVRKTCPSRFVGDVRNLPGWQWRTTVGQGRWRRKTSYRLFGLSNHCKMYTLWTLVSPMFINHLPAFIYVAHDALSKVGLTSTGSGAGHCAGANRPGHFSLFYIGVFHLFLLVLFTFFYWCFFTFLLVFFHFFLLVIFHFFNCNLSLFYIGDFSLGPTNFSRALCEGEKLPGMD